MDEIKISLECLEGFGECSNDEGASPTMDVEESQPEEGYISPATQHDAIDASPTMDVEGSEPEEEYIINPAMQSDALESVQVDPLEAPIKVETDIIKDVESEEEDYSSVETMTPRQKRAKFSCRCRICGSEFDDVSVLTQHVTQHEKAPELLRNLLTNAQGTSGKPQAVNVSVEKTGSKEIQVDNPKIISNICVQKPASMPVKITETSKKPPSKNTQKKAKTNQKHSKQQISVAEKWKKNICPFCDLQCGSRPELVSHRKTHIIPITSRADNECDEDEPLLIRKYFGCDFCKVTFLSKRSLHAHARTHVREIGNECEECNVYFPTRQTWDAHVSLHKMYQCHLCAERFTLNKELFAHLRTHDSFFAFTCNKCKERFRERWELVKHRKIHKWKPEPWREFSMIGELEQWRVCEICDRKFKRDYVHRSHMPTHAPFFCHVCNARYKEYNKLRQHMQTEGHCYECNACGEKFKHKFSLKVHLSSLEKDEMCPARIAGSDMPSSSAQ